MEGKASPYDLMPDFDSVLNTTPNEISNVTSPDKMTEPLPADPVKNVDSKRNQPERPVWSQKIEFILTCVGYAVGLGNIWRFPYLCHKNGGGTFLVPYAIMLAGIGLPIFFFELAFGQFASQGPITIWTISPLFKGIGYVMVNISAIFSIYYIVIVSYCVYFMFASLTTKLPWEECNSAWATKDCVSSLNTSLRISASPNQTSTYQYFHHFVMGQSDSLSDFGPPNWRLALSFFFAWIIVCIVLIKGIQSLGKAGYVTATFPYLILTVLMVRSAMLEGSLNGVIYYLRPRFNGLLKLEAWTDAATQIFFSLSTCYGGLIAMSSYNKFNNNCLRDAILVALVNCGTSIYAGFVIFSTLGYMAHISGKDVESVAEKGFTLAFVVYPEILSQLPFSQVWSFLFFFMMSLLGFGSDFCMMETVLSASQDELRRFNFLNTKVKEYIFRITFCILFSLLGFPMVCRGGSRILDMLDIEVSSGYPMLVTALVELLVIFYVYGAERYCEDIRLMIGVRPNIYWRVTWCYVSPFLLTVLLIIHFISRFEENSQFNTLKGWAKVLQILSGIGVVISLPVYFLYKFCREGGWILLKEFSKPQKEWGPVDIENRNLFLNTITDGDQLTKEEVGFFQSKQSIASKMTEKAQKEIKKQNSSGQV